MNYDSPVFDMDVQVKIESIRVLIENINKEILKTNSSAASFETAVRTLEQKLKQFPGLCRLNKIASVPLRQMIDPVEFKAGTEKNNVVGLRILEKMYEEEWHSQEYYRKLQELFIEVTEEILFPGFERIWNRLLTEESAEFVRKQERICEEYTLWPWFPEEKRLNEWLTNKEVYFLYQALHIFFCGRELLKNVLELKLPKTKTVELVALQEYKEAIMKAKKNIEMMC